MFMVMIYWGCVLAHIMSGEVGYGTAKDTLLMYDLHSEILNGWLLVLAVYSVQ